MINKSHLNPFLKIADILAGQGGKRVLSIEEKGEGKYSFSLSSDPPAPETARKTLEAFKKIFGEQDINRILDQLQMNSKDLILTKKMVRKIFIGFANFQDEAAFKKMDESLSNVKEVIDHVFFLDKAPSLEACRLNESNPDRGFKAFAEKVFLKYHHAKDCSKETDETKKMIRDAEFLSSRMAARNLFVGESLVLSDGEMYVVGKTVKKGGANISILRKVLDPSEVKIVCRGTAPVGAIEGVRSMLNDFQLRAGTWGIQATWQEIYKYLADEKIHRAEIYGKSLGGNHAQRLAVLLSRWGIEVTHLVTVCSIGGGEGLEKVAPNANIKTTIIRREGDAIPQVGGSHYGAGLEDLSNVKIYYIKPETEESTPMDTPLSYRKKIAGLATSSRPHSEQTTMADFTVREVSEEKKREQLETGKQLETTRKVVALLLHIVTFGWINKPFIGQVQKLNKKVKKLTIAIGPWAYSYRSS